MPCDELKALQAELEKVGQAQQMLRTERRHLQSGEHNQMKLQLQRDGMSLSHRIEQHKEHCPKCKES